MKKFTFLKRASMLIVCMMTLMVWQTVAQSPASMKYQAVLRDLDGKALSEKTVSIQIDLLQGAADGTVVFTETHEATTNAFGLTNLEVGSINLAGFSSVDWGNGPYFIKVTVDGDAIGTNQLLSVPYALHAQSAENVDDADADPTNEIQTISINENVITLSLDGGSVELPEGFDGKYSSLEGAPVNLSEFTNDAGFISLEGDPVNISEFTNDAGYITDPDDADADPTNELQTISIDENMVTLSHDGGSIELPEGFDGQYSSLEGAPTAVSAFANDSGYITDPDDADADPTNELQDLSLSGNELTISQGNTVVFDFDDADASPVNELQTISIDENVVTLSHDGGTIELPEGFDGQYSAVWRALPPQ